MPQRLPNDGIIWSRFGKDDLFRKFIVTTSGTSVTLATTSFSLFKSKRVVDLTKHLVQIIPAARVTLRGRSASPSSSGTFQRTSSSSTSTMKALAPKQDEDRFHHSEAYVAFLPIGKAESDRIVLRARDSHDALAWYRLFLSVRGIAQSEEESYPYGNPLEEKKAAPPAVAAGEGASQKAGGGVSHGPTTAIEGATTSSSGASSDDESDGSAARLRQRRGTAKPRRHSTAFEGIPQVKATSSRGEGSEEKSQRRRQSTAEATDYTLTLDAASSDSDNATQLRQRGGGRRTTLLATSGTTSIPKPHWKVALQHHDVAEGETAAFFERLWDRCSDPADELLHKPKEKVPLESEFAIATTSAARHSATGAYLFDQADQRTTTTAKAAILRTGVPVTVQSFVCRSPFLSASRSTEVNAFCAKCPILCLAHFDSVGMTLQLASGEIITIRYLDLVNLVPEFEPPKEAQLLLSGESRKSSDAPDQTRTSSLSQKKSSSSSSSKLLRRLSPTPSQPESNTLLLAPHIQEESPIAARLYSGSNDSIVSDRNGSLALQLPPEAESIVTPVVYRLQIYCVPSPDEDGPSSHSSPSRATLHALCGPPPPPSLVRRQVNLPDVVEVCLGFEFALEGKAVQRILIDGHARAVESVMRTKTHNAPQNEQFAHSLRPQSAFVGAYDARAERASCGVTTEAFPQSLLFSRNYSIGDSGSQKNNDILGAHQLALDCISYDLVQLYLNSARKAF